MLNRVVLVGRLTKDPELITMSTGIPKCSFTLAVNRSFSNQQTGEKEADYLPIVVWRKQAENVKNFIHKGSLVAVEGRIQTRNYDAQDGRKVYVTEIVADNVVFLEPKGSNGGDSQYSQSYSNNGQYGGGQYGGGQYGQNQYSSNQYQGNNYGYQQQPQQAPNNQQSQIDEEGAYKNIQFADSDLPF